MSESEPSEHAIVMRRLADIALELSEVRRELHDLHLRLDALWGVLQTLPGRVRAGATD